MNKETERELQAALQDLYEDLICLQKEAPPNETADERTKRLAARGCRITPRDGKAIREGVPEGYSDLVKDITRQIGEAHQERTGGQDPKREQSGS